LSRLNTTVSSAMGGGANSNYTVVIDQDDLQQVASCKKVCIEAVGLERGCVEIRSKPCIVGYLVMLRLPRYMHVETAYCHPSLVFGPQQQAVVKSIGHDPNQYIFVK